MKPDYPAASPFEREGMSARAVADRLQEVRRRISSRGKDPAAFRIVAVTKGFGPEAVAAALGAGLEDIGENYAQELLTKVKDSSSRAKWHFLGPIQRNKVARLAEVVSAWHGVDRTVEGEAIAAATPGVEAMIEVNVTGAASRPGCMPADVDELVARLRRLPLNLSGLMAIGPQGDLEQSRLCFRWLAEKASQLGLPELSMGMSDDFEVAVEEGATTLRLGRTLFGPRPSRTAARR